MKDPPVPRVPEGPVLGRISSSWRISCWHQPLECRAASCSGTAFAVATVVGVATAVMGVALILLMALRA